MASVMWAFVSRTNTDLVGGGGQRTNMSSGAFLHEAPMDHTDQKVQGRLVRRCLEHRTQTEGKYQVNLALYRLPRLRLSLRVRKGIVCCPRVQKPAIREECL